MDGKAGREAALSAGGKAGKDVVDIVAGDGKAGKDAALALDEPLSSLTEPTDGSSNSSNEPSSAPSSAASFSIRDAAIWLISP